MNGFQQIWSEIPYIIGGVKVTLGYALISMLLGFCGGIIITALRFCKIKILNLACEAYISVFRGTPLLLQLSIIYFAIPQFVGYQIPPFIAGITAFGLNSSAYVAEIIRAGIQSIDTGEIEIASLLGCNKVQIFRDIIIPQSIRNVLPSLVNEMVDLLKESALVSTIGETDLLRRANIVSSEHYTYIEPLLVAGACYYVLVMLLSRVAKLIERRLSCSK